MTGWEVAQIFLEIADLLDIGGDNPFKSRAYRRAARVLENTAGELEELVREGRLEQLPGIGAALEAKIRELVATGRLRYYEELKQKVPQGLREVLRIPGIGARTVHLLYRELKITSLEELAAAAREQRLRKLPGIGEKTEEAILQGIASLNRQEKRWLLHFANAVATEVEDFLGRQQGVLQVAAAGSYRRGRETVGDLDFVAASEDPPAVFRALRKAPWVERVTPLGENRERVFTRWGIQVDLLVVKPPFFITALHHSTGSREHLAILGERTQARLGETGLVRAGKTCHPRTEAELYQELGLSYIPAELREGRGEVEAALRGTLPRLVEQGDIKGDLHVHSDWSDGVNTLEELAAAARERGYSYLAITDHTHSLGVAHGLDEDRICRQLEAIHRLNARLEGLRLLAGMEVEILPDGRLDFDDRILAEVDIVVASVHSGFKQDRATMTERMLQAMRNAHIDIIGHPTGRLIGRREPYDVDVQRLLEVAAETGTALEINASPERLDLKDVYIKAGKELGVKYVISTDAHSLPFLDDMRYGILTARRGWAEAADVINTWPLPRLLEWLKGKA